MTDMAKLLPAVAKERRDGSVIMSFGDPMKGPHEQFDFHGSLELAQFIATACNSHHDLFQALRAARDIVAANCDGIYEVAVLEDAEAALAKAEATP